MSGRVNENEQAPHLPVVPLRAEGVPCIRFDALRLLVELGPVLDGDVAAINTEEGRPLPLPEKSVEILGEVDRWWVGHVPLVENESLVTELRFRAISVGYC